MHAPDWLFPTGLAEALAAVAQPDAQPVAGGTTLLDLLKMGHRQPRYLVDLSRLPLSGIEVGPDGLRIGATTSNTHVASAVEVIRDFPALSQAILLGASQQIRNAATVGGNLMQATRCIYFRTPDWSCNRRLPGSGCEAVRAPTHFHAVLGASEFCQAVQPSDMAVALLALDAVVHVEGAGGASRIPMKAFYLLPGSTPERQTALPAGSLITAVELPRSEAARRSAYIKLRGRASYEFASASAAAALTLEGDIVRSVAVALGGVGTIPWRSHEAEAVLVGKPLTAEAVDKYLDILLSGALSGAHAAHKIGLARGAVHRVLGELATS